MGQKPGTLLLELGDLGLASRGVLWLHPQCRTWCRNIDSNDLAKPPGIWHPDLARFVLIPWGSRDISV